MRFRNEGWVGFDFDRTLAVYHHHMYPALGDPIPGIVDLAKRILGHGYEIRLVTARVCDVLLYRYEQGDRSPEVIRDQEQRKSLGEWLFSVFGMVITVTNRKDFKMICLYDDRAKEVVPNTGALVGGEFDLRNQ